jgi:hypothetical protein
MARVFLSLSILSMLFLLIGCSDSSTGPATPGTPVQASLSDIQARVFTPSCALAGCHAGSSPAGGMNLAAGSSYTALVSIRSSLYASKLRVKPGSASESVLIGELRRELSPGMPPSGPLATAVIDSIAAWINAGAPNN